MEPKYTLVDFTKEEFTAFMNDFATVLKAHTAYFEPIPKMVRESAGKSWTVGCDMMLQKKVLITPEQQVNGETVADEPEVAVAEPAVTDPAVEETNA